jgi:hypothetical protein
MSLNPRGNPAGKIEIVIPVSPIESDGEKRLMKVELADLLASIPATNGALSAGVALLLKTVFTFGGRDDLDASANETIEDAVDMVLAGIAMYDLPGAVKLPETSQAFSAAASGENSPDAVQHYFGFLGYFVPKPAQRNPQHCGPETFSARLLPAKDGTSKGDAVYGVVSNVSGQWVLNISQDNGLFTGLPRWAEDQATRLATNLNAKLAADAGAG